MLPFIALQWVLTPKNGAHLQRRESYYRDRSFFLLQLENKQQIMPNNVETQYKRMYSFITGRQKAVGYCLTSRRQAI